MFEFVRYSHNGWSIGECRHRVLTMCGSILTCLFFTNMLRLRHSTTQNCGNRLATDMIVTVTCWHIDIYTVLANFLMSFCIDVIAIYCTAVITVINCFFSLYSRGYSNFKLVIRPSGSSSTTNEIVATAHGLHLLPLSGGPQGSGIWGQRIN